MTANFAFQFPEFGFTRAREAGMVCDLAMRDVEIALGGFALSQLTTVRERVSEKKRSKEIAGSQMAASR